MKRIFASKRTRWAAIVVVIALPALLAAYGIFEKNRPPIRYGVDYTIADYLLMNADIILGLLFLLVSAVPFFLVFDRRRPQARELVPVAVMAAIAVVGRAVFSIVPLPHFKPCSAIIMITAVVFGPETGFLTGALTAFVSNFLFGQGPWTPWQMFCWGLIGFLTGLMKNAGLFATVGHITKQTKPHFVSPKWDRLCPPDTTRGDLLAFVRQTTERAPLGLCLWGLATGFVYGWIMNVQFIFGYVNPITWQTVLAAYENIYELNDLALAVSKLSMEAQKKLGAVVEMAEPESASQIRHLAENLDQFEFASGAHTPAEYGRFMIQESGHFEYDENLEGFYDYEKFGLQRMEQESGMFTDRGYVSYHGTMSLEELMMEDPAESFREEQGLQMGAMK